MVVVFENIEVHDNLHIKNWRQYIFFTILTQLVATSYSIERHGQNEVFQWNMT